MTSKVLVPLGQMVSRARSAVDRNSNTRQIELIPMPEAPTRVTLALAGLLKGLKAIGVGEVLATRAVVRVGLDSIPALRRKAIDVLAGAEAPLSLKAIARTLRYPPTTVWRALEDLEAHRVVRRSSPEKEALWSLTRWTRRRYVAIHTVPEKSPHAQEEERACAGADISGKAKAAASAKTERRRADR